MAPSPQLGIDKLIVHGNLELPSIRWHDGEAVDLELKFL
jgi:hypothetical protein